MIVEPIKSWRSACGALLIDAQYPGAQYPGAQYPGAQKLTVVQSLQYSNNVKLQRLWFVCETVSTEMCKQISTGLLFDYQGQL